jgi:hypothetical protein
VARAQRGVIGYAASPSIYVLHVDRPERHSLLSGGHEHDVTQLAWAPLQLGLCLLSADARAALCVWRPVAGLTNRWELSHRLMYPHVRLCLFANAAPALALPPPYTGAASLQAYSAVHAQAKPKCESYHAKYRRDAPRAPDGAAGAAGAAPGIPDVSALVRPPLSLPPPPSPY